MIYENKIIPAGTKVVFKANAGFAGTDTADFFVLTRDMKDSELYIVAWLFAIEDAESYGIYPTHEKYEDEVENDPDSYSENIERWYEIYNPEEHDGLRVGYGTELKFQKI